MTLILYVLLKLQWEYIYIKFCLFRPKEFFLLCSHKNLLEGSIVKQLGLNESTYRLTFTIKLKYDYNCSHGSGTLDLFKF